MPQASSPEYVGPGGPSASRRMSRGGFPTERDDPRSLGTDLGDIAWYRRGENELQSLLIAIGSLAVDRIGSLSNILRHGTA